MMKKNIPALMSLIIGIGCFVTYSIIGSEVAADGTLLEPFFLIPIGYLFLAIGIIFGLAVSIASFFRKPQKTD